MQKPEGTGVVGLWVTEVAAAAAVAELGLAFLFLGWSSVDSIGSNQPGYLFLLSCLCSHRKDCE